MVKIKNFEKREEYRKVKEALSQSRAFLRKAEKRGESSSVISGAKEATKKFDKRKEQIERGVRVKERFKKFGKKVMSGDLKVLKKKILTKPHAKIQSISARKTLKSFAQSSEPLVRQVEPKELVRDDRSLYFNKAFIEEERSNNKWLS